MLCCAGLDFVAVLGGGLVRPRLLWSGLVWLACISWSSSRRVRSTDWLQLLQLVADVASGVVWCGSLGCGTGPVSSWSTR